MRLLRDEIAVVGLLNSLKHSDTTVRRQAARALGKSALETPVALRQFGRALADKDSSVRLSAVQGLAALGEAALPLLIDALDHEDRHVRREAAGALGELGATAEPAVPALIRAIEDDDRKLAARAIRALGCIGPAAKPAMPRLIAILSGTHFVCTRQAAWALSQLGAAAVDPLLQAIRTGDLYTRCEAIWALAQMGREARAAVPALINLLRTHGLSRIAKTVTPPPGDSMANTAPVLIRPRHGTEDAFWTNLIVTLGEIGPEAREAAPILREVRQSGYGTAQVLAARALERIAPGAAA